MSVRYTSSPVAGKRNRYTAARQGRSPALSSYSNDCLLQDPARLDTETGFFDCVSLPDSSAVFSGRLQLMQATPGKLFVSGILYLHSRIERKVFRDGTSGLGVCLLYGAVNWS